jgi:hypothetical protein
VQVLGQCINAAAVAFDAVPELAVLPPHLFASVVRTAQGIQCPRALLQVCPSNHHPHSPPPQSSPALPLS